MCHSSSNWEDPAITNWRDSGKENVDLTGNGTSSYFSGNTWYLNGEDSLGLSFEKEVRSNGTTEYKHYVSAGGTVFALFTSRSGTLNGLPATSTSYFYKDQLGSIAAITNETGAVTERLAYDPWGRRRYINTTPGLPDTLDAIVGVNTDRGYTEHEHLDEVGVIHMNGRIYDPLIGRFMSADPIIQAPDNLKSFNRYSYVWNNPLNTTDPTGFEGEPGDQSDVRTLREVTVIATRFTEYSHYEGPSGWHSSYSIPMPGRVIVSGPGLPFLPFFYIAPNPREIAWTAIALEKALSELSAKLYKPLVEGAKKLPGVKLAKAVLQVVLSEGGERDNTGADKPAKSPEQTESDAAVNGLTNGLPQEIGSDGKPKRGQYVNTGGDPLGAFDALPGTIGPNGQKTLPDGSTAGIHPSTTTGLDTIHVNRPSGSQNVKVRYQ